MLFSIQFKAVDLFTCVIREKRDEVAKIKDELRSKGCEVLPDKRPEEHFDSNCITPVSIVLNLDQGRSI